MMWIIDIDEDESRSSGPRQYVKYSRQIILLQSCTNPDANAETPMGNRKTRMGLVKVGLILVWTGSAGEGELHNPSKYSICFFL